MSIPLIQRMFVKTDHEPLQDMADIELLLEKPQVNPSSSQHQQQERCLPPSSFEGDEQEVDSHSYHGQARPKFRFTCATATCMALTIFLVLLLVSITATITFDSVKRHQLNFQIPTPSLPVSKFTNDLSLPSSSISTLPATISCSAHPSAQQQQEGDCVFDPILMHWLPKQCMNMPLLQATLNTTSPLAQPPYEIAGTFAHQIYSDPELQHRLSFEEVSQLKQNPFYVTLRYHRAHCAYIFRMISDAADRKAELVKEASAVIVDGKQKEVIVGGGTEEGDIGKGVYVWRDGLSKVHSEHCAKVLAWREGDLDNSEKFIAGGGTCVLL